MKVYKIHSECLFVRGANRSTILDLPRRTYYLVPNALHDIIKNNEGMEVQQVVRLFNGDEAATVQEYFVYLFEREIIFEINAEMADHFPPLAMEHDIPAEVSNIILDSDGPFTYDVSSVINEALTLNCLHFQVRFYKHVPFDYLKSFLKIFDDSIARSIEVILPHTNEKPDQYIQLIKDFPRIRCIIFHSAESNGWILDQSDSLIYKTTQKITGHSMCGTFSHHKFAANIELATESFNHNTCLNKKISVDVAGNIKNCPSMKDSFGNIKNTTLRSALNRTGFKKFWNIKKDTIAGCKDCEFRHICTDCRAYLEDPNDMHSKPLKCGYNPYTNEWEEWSTNPLKKAAIEHYKYELQSH